MLNFLFKLNECSICPPFSSFSPNNWMRGVKSKQIKMPAGRFAITEKEKKFPWNEITHWWYNEMNIWSLLLGTRLEIIYGQGFRFWNAFVHESIFVFVCVVHWICRGIDFSASPCIYIFFFCTKFKHIDTSHENRLNDQQDVHICRLNEGGVVLMETMSHCF